MSNLACPNSPKHGYHFDPQEHDVVKVRKERRCQGGTLIRGYGGGTHAPNCTGTISKGDIACATVTDLFDSYRYACLPCALTIGAVKPVDPT